MTHGVAPLLISAAAGYWMLIQAGKEKAQLKKIGQVVGVVILVASLAGAACKIYYQVTGCVPEKGIFCPYGSKTQTPPARMP